MQRECFLVPWGQSLGARVRHHRGRPRRQRHRHPVQRRPRPLDLQQEAHHRELHHALRQREGRPLRVLELQQAPGL
jgi:hypothetical protein